MSPIPLGSVRPDPREAHEWLREELLRRDYRPSLLKQVQDWFGSVLDRVQHSAGNAGGLGRLVVLVLVVALLLLVAVVLSRLRRLEGGEPETQAVFGDVRRSAAEHRRLAETAFGNERWDDAVVEAMRALAAGLVERRLADDLPAATAHEVATAAAPRFPAYGDRLAAAARTFDETRYGDRRATRERARAMLDLDHDLRSAAPSGGGRGPVEAVPR